MDVSKLPRMSKTDTPKNESANPAPNPIAYQTLEPTSSRGPEVWFSIGIGLILLLMFPHFTQWLIHAIFHTKLPSFLPITDVNTGAEIPYVKSDFFMNDLSISAFGYALIFEGIALLGFNRPGVVMLTLFVTTAAVLLNLWYLATSYSTQGLSIISAVAVLVGGYMMWYQWNLLRGMRLAQRYARAAQQAAQ